MFKVMKQALGKFLGVCYRFVLRFVNWLVELDHKREHILLTFNKGVLKVSLTEHEQFIKNKNKKIKKYQKKHSPKETIKQALKLAADGCNFVIFQSKDNEDKFIRFWTDRGRLNLDLPVSKTNGLFRYRLAIIGLLASLEFIKRSLLISDFNYFSRYKHFFTVDKSDKDLWSIEANFHKNYELCTKFVYLFLKNIFKANLKDIEIKLA